MNNENEAKMTIIGGIALVLTVLLMGCSKPRVQEGAVLEKAQLVGIERETQVGLFLVKTTDYAVIMPKNIAYTEQFSDVYHILLTAKKGSTVTFVIEGNGGRIDIFLKLASLIKQSDAHVVMNVVGDVSSAHAFLSLEGDELKVTPYAHFMFHHSSVLNADTGWYEDYKEEKDRGLSLIDKIKAGKAAHLKDFGDFIADTEELTDEDLVKIFDGHDVFIEAEEIKRRFDEAKRVSKVKHQ